MNYGSGGLDFVGCLFFGSGLGMLFDNLVAGGPLGLGADLSQCPFWAGKSNNQTG